MPSLKHYLHESHKHAVVCEWDLRTGTWSCSSTVDDRRYTGCSLKTLNHSLKDQGYVELE